MQAVKRRLKSLTRVRFAAHGRRVYVGPRVKIDRRSMEDALFAFCRSGARASMTLWHASKNVAERHRRLHARMLLF